MTTQGLPSGVVSSTDAHYVDWGTIILGTAVASAIATVLFTFGAGIGLSMVSPYQGEGISKTGYFAALALWTVWVVLSSCAAGGYIAGRLRRRIGDGTEHEVEVRDGAHGLGVWAMSVVIASLLLALGVSGIVGSAARVAGPAAATAAANSDPNAATLDALFRAPEPTAAIPAPDGSAPAPADQMAAPVPPPRDAAADRAEINRLLTNGTVRGELSADNKTYVARLVAAHTGMSQSEAERRVTEVSAEAQRKAEAARKLGILIAFATAAALLVGAAAAAWTSTLGGKHRDQGTDFSAFWRWS